MSNKYVLDPSGKIVVNGELKDANEASEKILKNQNDFFQQRRQSTADKAFNAARASLPAGAITGIDSKLSDIDLTQFETLLTSETPDFPNPRDGQEGHVIFPRKKNNQLLINPSFGADKDTDINYYTPYNSIFSKDKSNRRVYAEELEMLTGLDLNSLGLSASGIGGRDGINSDFTQILFIFDFLIESLAYIGTFWLINLINKSTKNNDTAIQYYFSKILNTGNYVETTDLFALFNYYIVGLDRFINTDPKSKSLRDISNFDDPNRIKFFDLFRVAIRNVLSISKVGRNRMFLLIRKFQQKSYWHTELLYKHKQDTSENGVDKFFIEFSNYYFKFIIERINIGYIVLNKNKITTRNSNLDTLNLYNDQLTRNFDPIRLGRDSLKDILDETGKRAEFNTMGSKNIYYDDQNFTYDGKDYLLKGKFKTSITSLPQLFLGSKDNQTSNINFVKKKDSSQSRRLPQELVKKVESYLDNEYMPFYLHDLRTNEIVSMHAFLDSISDSFSPEYTSNSGYGRIDDVKHYVKTTRNINITFSLVSMQADDHDLMWYQINKIVSMVYPQWSAGIPATTGKLKDINGFTYPFTQVPTASPLIRLRVGDVLKSNYTKKNIERLHFSKEPKFIKEQKYINIADNFLAFAYIKSDSIIKKYNKDDIKEKVKKQNNNAASYLKNDLKGFEFIIDSESSEGSTQKRLVIPKNKKNKNIKITTPTVAERRILFENSAIPKKFKGNKELDYKKYKFFVIEREALEPSSGVTDAQFKRDPKAFGTMYYYREYFAINLTNHKTREIEFSEGVVNKKDILNAETDGKQINNPYTKAFETARGKGLAGFITSLDVNYQDVTWETNNPGSNAPHSVKITMGFSPIHDIAPGLDHEGVMRAPIYNVGSLNKSLFGDVE